MTNPNYAEIAFILDRSGSMERCRDAAIQGFNAFLADQQNVEGLAKLTLVLFDDEYLVPVSSVPVQEVVPLTHKTFVPRNCTALLDAIGQTIDDLGNRLAGLPTENRPREVIVAVLTDGFENASRHFTWKQVAARIKHQTDTYKWTFLFLGANQDAIATAAQISIAAHNAACFVADDAGSRASHKAFSRKARALRKCFSPEQTAEEAADAAASLSDIVREEDEKERS
jgi:hypothetical protein